MNRFVTILCAIPLLGLAVFCMFGGPVPTPEVTDSVTDRAAAGYIAPRSASSIAITTAACNNGYTCPAGQCWDANKGACYTPSAGTDPSSTDTLTTGALSAGAAVDFAGLVNSVTAGVATSYTLYSFDATGTKQGSTFSGAGGGGRASAAKYGASLKTFVQGQVSLGYPVFKLVMVH